MAKSSRALDVHSYDFRVADIRLGELIHRLRKSTEIIGEVKSQTVAELTAGQAYLKAPKLRRHLIEELLTQPLARIIATNAPEEIRSIATEYSAWLDSAF